MKLPLFYIKILSFVVFGLLFFSCRANSNNNTKKIGNSKQSTPLFAIHFEKNISFGTTDEHLVGVRGWGNVVTDEKNRVYIPDYRTNVIHVFDSTGQYISQMGRKGKGPGEYLHMSAFAITPDYLYIFGHTLYKITAYSLDSLAYSYTIPLNREGWEDVESLRNWALGNRAFFVTDDGKILMNFFPVVKSNWTWANLDQGDLNKKRIYQFYWLNKKGEVISDMVLEQKGVKSFVVDARGSKAITTFKRIFGEPLTAMSNDGIIAAAWSIQFNIEILDRDGTLIKVIKFPFKNAPLKRQQLIDRYHRIYNYTFWLLKSYKSMNLPETWPALKKLFFDSHKRLWVAAIVPNLKVYKWFIFNIEGQLLARFTWPRDKDIEFVNNGYMYISKGKKGVRRIYRYKIVMIKK